MSLIRMKSSLLAVTSAAVALSLLSLPALAKPKEPIPLKEAKFIIEHNATDHDK